MGKHRSDGCSGSVRRRSWTSGLSSSLARVWRAGTHGGSWRRCPVRAGFLGPVPDDLGVYGARDAVVELCVQLGELVAGVDWSLGDVSDGCGLDDVPDDKLPDGLVLGAGESAVGATNVVDVAAPVLGTAPVASLGGHLEPSLNFDNCNPIREKEVRQ